MAEFVTYTPEQVFEILIPDEDFANLTDRDNSTELIGSVVHVIAPEKVGNFGKKHDLFKFVISNGRNCRIMCLFWNELIEEYQHEITISRVIHIDGATTKAAIKNNEKTLLGVLPFEIVIQKASVVKYLGTYSVLASIDNPSISRLVNFETIKDAVDKKISIQGYIKTKFAKASTKNKNMSYGCGAICDGTYKITVQIGNYTPLAIDKGVYVIVVGTIINVDGLLKISCRNSSDITPHDDHDSMPAEKLIRGTKQVTALKRAHTK